MKYKCPCCGNYTYLEPVGGTDEICPVCFWEDDKIQLKDITYAGGANAMSLQEARENYKEFGACCREMLEHVRKPMEDELPENNEGAKEQEAQADWDDWYEHDGDIDG